MSSVINAEILNQLREMLGDDFGLILDSFHEEGTSIVAQMEVASANGDLKVMKEAAHSMKSMSGNVGAMELSEISDKIQVAAANSDQDKVSALWLEFQANYALVVEELKQY